MAQLVHRTLPPYRTDDPMEIGRMKARGYVEDADGLPPTIEDVRFHPAGKSVAEIQHYLAENPGDAERVIAEEKAGKARATIVGDSAPPAPAEG
jgi:hypothetical protein